jgi:hypothetical protein
MIAEVLVNTGSNIINLMKETNDLAGIMAGSTLKPEEIIHKQRNLWLFSTERLLYNSESSFLCSRGKVNAFATPMKKAIKKKRVSERELFGKKLAWPLCK